MQFSGSILHGVARLLLAAANIEYFLTLTLLDTDLKHVSLTGDSAFFACFIGLKNYKKWVKFSLLCSISNEGWSVRCLFTNLLNQQHSR